MAWFAYYALIVPALFMRPFLMIAKAKIFGGILKRNIIKRE